MVVILIIGILIAIALPTYLGTRRTAADRATQSELRTGLAAAMTYFSGGITYTGFDPVSAKANEPSIDWAGPGAPALGQIGIQTAAGSALLLVSRSETGTYWCVAQIPNSPATSRGGDANFSNVDTTAECAQGW